MGIMTLRWPRHSQALRLGTVIALIVMGVAGFACSPVDTAEPTVIEPVVIDTDDETPRNQPLEEGDVAAMTARTATRACEGRCKDMVVYVLEALDDVGTPMNQGQPMPEAVRSAITDVLPEAIFVVPADVGALYDAEGLIDGGAGVLLQLGPVKRIRADVVGINGYVTTAGDGLYGTTYLFAWDGSRWVPTTRNETDVTVTSIVS